MVRKQLLFAWCVSMVLTACAVGQGAVAGSAATVAEQYLMAAANQERTAHGLSMLHRDPLLALAAVHHAQAMATHASISHQFSGESDLTVRAADAGVRFSVISENVGEAPSAVRIHEMWMHSTEHRANLLDPTIDAAGISVIARGGELFAVEDFVRTVRPAGIEEQERSIAELIAQAGLTTQPGGMVVDRAPATIAAARQTCSMSTGYAGARKPWFVMRFTSDSLAALPEELKNRLASGRFHEAAVGACADTAKGPFTSYNLAVLLYP